MDQSLAQRLHAKMQAKGLNPGPAATKALYELADLIEKSQEETMRVYLTALMDELRPVIEKMKARIAELERRG